MTPLPPETARSRGWLVAAGVLAVALPFLVVRYPPATDLPQHAAQLRLLFDTLAGHTALYRIQWLTPYSLSYTALALAWPLLGAGQAARFGLFLLAALWVGATHFLAARRGRPGASALLAGALVFNHTLYWGFVPFLGGWALFVLWLLEWARPAAATLQWRSLARRLALALALYFCHALWFAVACLWLLVDGLRRRVPSSEWIVRGASIAPVALLAAVWFPSLREQGFFSPTVWGGVSARLASLGSGVLGGLRGPLEPVLLVLIGLWVGWGLWSAGPQRRRSIDSSLLTAAAMFLGLALVLPARYQNVIHFADRWLPSAAVCLVLAMPAPRWREGLRRAVAAVVVALFCSLTAAYWLANESVDLDGLEVALDALPERPRVLSLAFDDRSALLEGHPFHNQGAWAQALHGGTQGFSFAEFAPSLVVYRDATTVQWQRALDWFPRRAQADDFAYFDFVLVQGAAGDQDRVAALGALQPVTPPARWRLYRVPPRGPAQSP